MPPEVAQWKDLRTNDDEDNFLKKIWGSKPPRAQPSHFSATPLVSVIFRQCLIALKYVSVFFSFAYQSPEKKTQEILCKKQDYL